MPKSKFNILVGVFVALFTNTLNGQVIKLKNGLTISKLNSTVIPVLNDYTKSYNVSVGLEYLENENFLINSEVGYFQKGGSEEGVLNAAPPLSEKYSKKWGYLSVSTTFRYKIPMRGDFLYIGAGPQADVLLSNDKDFSNTAYDGVGYTLNKMSIGVLPEAGFVMDREKMRYGIELSYLIGISNIGSSPFVNLKSNALRAGISIGYKF